MQALRNLFPNGMSAGPAAAMTSAGASGSAADAEFNEPPNVKSHPDDTRTELTTQQHFAANRRELMFRFVVY